MIVDDDDLSGRALFRQLDRPGLRLRCNRTVGVVGVSPEFRDTKVQASSCARRVVSVLALAFSFMFKIKYLAIMPQSHLRHTMPLAKTF